MPGGAGSGPAGVWPAWLQQGLRSASLHRTQTHLCKFAFTFGERGEKIEELFQFTVGIRHSNNVNKPLFCLLNELFLDVNASYMRVQINVIMAKCGFLRIGY